MNRDLSVIGHALAAPVRSTMLNLLMDGSQRPATELSTERRADCGELGTGILHSVRKKERSTPLTRPAALG